MGNVLVLYHTESGNTGRMAQLVAEGASHVPGTQVRLKPIADAGRDDILWCDGIALGSPTHVGVLSWPMKKFWDDLVDDLWGEIDGKIGCAFSSSGGWGGGSEIACLSLLIVLINYGFLVFGVPDYVGKQFTLHYGVVVSGEPRSDDERAACLRLGKRLATWVAVFREGRRELHPRSA